MDDKAFYQRRLREELARSKSETDPKLRALHRRWASLYLERLANLSPERLAAA